MNSLELKIPPPLVALGFALLMWLAARIVPSFDMPQALRVALCVALVAAGACISVAGMVSFRRAKTTVNPLRPSAASSLVVSGVYRLTRNPMYLGLLLVLLGWAVFLSNPGALLLAPLFVVCINQFQIAPEERALKALFGSEYAAFQARVRRWI